MTEDDALNAMAEDMVKVAGILAPDYKMDPVAAAMALGFAMTKLLFRTAPDHATALQSVQIANQSAVKAMADMVTGKDTPHQVLQ